VIGITKICVLNLLLGTVRHFTIENNLYIWLFFLKNQVIKNLPSTVGGQCRCPGALTYRSLPDSLLLLLSGADTLYLQPASTRPIGLICRVLLNGESNPEAAEMAKTASLAGERMKVVGRGRSSKHSE
jgi:hypothetical protein